MDAVHFNRDRLNSLLSDLTMANFARHATSSNLYFNEPSLSLFTTPHPMPNFQKQLSLRRKNVLGAAWCRVETALEVPECGIT
ncbi:hypothetical protein O9992_00890 [Vibrio lentus]|nr:hypothetical protein [Vibrio lentus]